MTSAFLDLDDDVAIVVGEKSRGVHAGADRPSAASPAARR